MVVALVLGTTSGCLPASSDAVTTTTTITTEPDPPTTTAAPATSAPTTSSTPEARDGWYLLWVTGRLPEGFSAGLTAVEGVDVVSVVRMGNGHLVETRDAAGTVIDRPAPGFVIPVEVHALDATAHAEYVPEDVARTLLALDDHEVALGVTSARVRRLGVGSELTFEGDLTVTVAAVVEDRWVGDAEVVTTRIEATDLGAGEERYVVLHFNGDRASLEAGAAQLTEEIVQIKAEGETGVFRYGDVVRSQAAIKDRFGEFAYRLEGDGFVPDPGWVAAHIVSADVALVGRVTCHRDFVEVLRSVMNELESDGFADVVDPAAFAGCWNARFIAGRRDLSHHSWGIAADINFFNDPASVASPAAQELIEAMERAGVTSGVAWLNPDPGHYEWFVDAGQDPSTLP